MCAWLSGVKHLWSPNTFLSFFVRVPPWPESVQPQGEKEQVAPQNKTVRVVLLLSGLGMRKRTPRWMVRRVQVLQSEPEHPPRRQRCPPTIWKMKITCSAVFPAASPRRMGRSFSATSLNTGPTPPPSSAYSAVSASRHLAPSAGTASSLTACGTHTAMPIEPPRVHTVLPVARLLPRLRCRVRTEMGIWAARCVADVLTRPQTSIPTSGPMAWPSSPHTKQTSLSREERGGAFVTDLSKGCRKWNGCFLCSFF